jgi:hypothetical protein
VISSVGGGTSIGGGVSIARLFPTQIPGCNCSITKSISPLLLVERFSGVAILHKIVGVGISDWGIGVDVFEGAKVAIGTTFSTGAQDTKIKVTNRIVTLFLIYCIILQRVAQRLALPAAGGTRLTYETDKTQCHEKSQFGGENPAVRVHAVLGNFAPYRAPALGTIPIISHF